MSMSLSLSLSLGRSEEIGFGRLESMIVGDGNVRFCLGFQ